MRGNNLGQYIPVAVADTTTYPGSDYYEIALVEYEEKMHTDLPATRLRGYVQLATGVVPGSQVPLVNPDGSEILLPNGTQAVGVDSPHYLGPLISPLPRTSLSASCSATCYLPARAATSSSRSTPR